MLFKCSHLFKASDMVWGLICARHHLSASFGQDVAVNGSLALSLTPHPSKSCLRCCLEIFHFSSPDSLSFQEMENIFFLGQAKVLFCVLSLYTRTPILCMSEGCFDFQCWKGFVCALFVFLLLFFLQKSIFVPKKGISCGPGCGILLAFRGTEEKIKASLSCLDKRRKIKSCYNLTFPKRKERHKRICQREESLIIKGEKQ